MGQFLGKHKLSILVMVLALGIFLQIILSSGADAWTAIASGLRPPHSAIEPLVTTHRPLFQTGMIFPQWGSTAYSMQDANWSTGLKDISQQTGAKWIEMTVNLYQSSLTSTTVTSTQKTPTPQALAQGIAAAHAMHYHVFVVPLLTVQGVTSKGALLWCGDIRFSTDVRAQQWFDSYWNAFKPYATAASLAGAEQLAIGTELEELQFVVPRIWTQLINRIHAVFPRSLTYDMNWSSLTLPVTSWMHNPYLSALGVSEYISLTNVRQRLDPNILSQLWHDKIKPQLDTLARKSGKPVVISEIGYRNSSDALYHPWEKDTPAHADEEEQSAAYGAALANSTDDPAINGIFFWAWSFYLFEPNQHAAANMLHEWYTVRLV